MYKIVCPSCNKENSFSNLNDIPDKCDICFETIPKNIEIIDTGNNTTFRIAIELIYQKNQKSIKIPDVESALLGREGYGANIFNEILNNSGKSVISRKHCYLKKIDGDIYLEDAGSLNGTFYSETKISCNGSPQKLKQDDFIYLGQELFIVKFITEETDIDDANRININEENETVPKNIFYRCKTCGHTYSEYQDYCDNCKEFGTLIQIEE